MDRTRTVRGVYDEWERGNYRAGFELYEPDITLEVHSPIPDAGVYPGLAGLQSYMRDFLANFVEYSMKALSVEERGDQVVVQIRHGGIGAGAGPRTEMEYFAIWTFEGERVTKLEIAAEP
jgi:ketosteroid isomerase-like protein